MFQRSNLTHAQHCAARAPELLAFDAVAAWAEQALGTLHGQRLPDAVFNLLARAATGEPLTLPTAHLVFEIAAAIVRPAAPDLQEAA